MVKFNMVYLLCFDLIVEHMRTNKDTKAKSIQTDINHSVHIQRSDKKLHVGLHVQKQKYSSLILMQLL